MCIRDRPVSSFAGGWLSGVARLRGARELAQVPRGNGEADPARGYREPGRGYRGQFGSGSRIPGSDLENLPRTVVEFLRVLAG